MKTDILLKNVEFDYKHYSSILISHCPYCSYGSTAKTKTYKTLKSLLFHLAHEHRNEGDYFPFDSNSVHQIMNAVALAKQWRILS